MLNTIAKVLYSRGSGGSTLIYSTVIFYLQGSGTSYSINKYQYTDINNSSATSFYRVKQVDNDGHYTYSNVVQMDGGSGEFSVNVVPNPARNSSLRFYFTLPSISQTIDFTVFNALGNPVLKRGKFVVSSGYYEITSNAFPTGYYFITARTAKGMYVKSFVIAIDVEVCFTTTFAAVGCSSPTA